MWVRVSTWKPFTAVLVALIGLAWLVLWVWGQSPYGRFLSHRELGEVSLGRDPVLSLLFVTGWTLMTVAMMLPTSLPLVALFHTFTNGRPNHLRLVSWLIFGYLISWTLFGFVVHVGDWGLHQVVTRIGWFDTNAWVIGASILVTAGIYQFTPLKYHCLEKCRSPLSFIMGHWRGKYEEAQAFRLGIDHGLFCLGCCWSLMLLMFGIGVGNIGWMLVLGMVMGIEKNMPWGRRLSIPLGLVLVGWGLLILLDHSWSF